MEGGGNVRVGRERQGSVSKDELVLSTEQLQTRGCRVLTSVVGLCDGIELLLTCRVPQH